MPLLERRGFIRVAKLPVVLCVSACVGWVAPYATGDVTCVVGAGPASLAASNPFGGGTAGDEPLYDAAGAGTIPPLHALPGGDRSTVYSDGGYLGIEPDDGDCAIYDKAGGGSVSDFPGMSYTFAVVWTSWLVLFPWCDRARTIISCVGLLRCLLAYIVHDVVSPTSGHRVILCRMPCCYSSV